MACRREQLAPPQVVHLSSVQLALLIQKHHAQDSKEHQAVLKQHLLSWSHALATTHTQLFPHDATGNF